MAYFELRTPRDMLEKAERELGRLQIEFTIDNIFNFFVTAYHIQDYVKETKKVPRHILDAFLADPDLKDCQALCNKGKHLRLKQHPEAVTDIVNGGFGGAAFGEVAFGEGDVLKLFYGGRAVEVRGLPDRIMEKWRQFLTEYGL